MRYKDKKNQKGFSLIEVAMAMGVVAVFLGVVTAGGGMMKSARVQREANAIDSLRLAAQNYLSSSYLTYKGISIDILKERGFVALAFEAEKSNSFGGDYVVNVNQSDDTKVDIALAAIPEDAALALSGIFKGKAEGISYDKTDKVWLATF